MSKLSTAKLKGIPSTLGQVSIPAGHTFEVDGNLDLSTNTGALQLPTGNTANRPGSPSVGYVRYNTDNNKVEIYSGTNGWVDIGTGNYTTESGVTEYLIYFHSSSGDARAPNAGILGSMSTATANSVEAVPWAEVDADSTWTHVKFTSVNNPSVMYRIERGSEINNVLQSLLNPYASWSMSNNQGQSVVIAPGSSGRVGDTMYFQHNNGGGETHDIVTLASNTNVWSNGMVWGQIDSTGNYGGILNTVYPHSGSGGGNTGDTLLIYLETANSKANPVATDYTNYLTPTGPIGNAQNFTWTYDGTSGLGGNPNMVADTIDRTTTSSWSSYGFQQNGDNRYIQVDLVSPQSFDYTFAIGYVNDSHWSDENYIEGSNDGSNWTAVGQWKYHNGSGNADGYLIYNQGNHTYSNTISNPSKWIPLYNDGTAYRYWRLHGTNFGASNNYMLVKNWALLKKN